LTRPRHARRTKAQGQHFAREQERAETARQGTLTVTFTARKSPVQATSRARQPIHQPHCHLFSKFIPSAPNGGHQPRREAQRSGVGWMQCWAASLSKTPVISTWA